ncbi:MAG: ABC transporter ATP-binding protein [Candidatus Melainabacteria bacterium]|nr:ABC transporter ATP-binding protein [Candidatus Melainabacteria bacterium]
MEQFISVENLVKTYRLGKVKAVNGASFHVNQGEIFGLIGPNGAGKTTIMGCLLALVKATSGTVTIDGKSPLDLDVKRMTGFLPERPSYNRWMTIHQFLSYHHMLAEQPSTQREGDIKRVLSMVELDIDPKSRRVKELSRGMLQRVGLAQAFIGRPTLCFFDEPTSGMDPLGFILMRKLLKNCKDDGITVILNSHHLQEVEKVCDQVAFIRQGRIEYQDRVDRLSEEKSIILMRWNCNDDAIASNTTMIQAAAGRHSATIIEVNDNNARFTVADKNAAAELLCDVVASGIKVYEMIFEKRELVDLFLSSGSVEDTPSGASLVGIEQPVDTSHSPTIKSSGGSQEETHTESSGGASS